MTEARYWGLVPAAGLGSRMGSGCPKQYLPLLEQTVLEQTLTRLLAWNRLEKVMVALHPEDHRFSQLPVAGDSVLPVVTGAQSGLIRYWRGWSPWLFGPNRGIGCWCMMPPGPVCDYRICNDCVRRCMKIR